MAQPQLNLSLQQPLCTKVVSFVRGEISNQTAVTAEFCLREKYYFCSDDNQ